MSPSLLSNDSISSAIRAGCIKLDEEHLRALGALESLLDPHRREAQRESPVPDAVIDPKRRTARGRGGILEKADFIGDDTADGRTLAA